MTIAKGLMSLGAATVLCLLAPLAAAARTVEEPVRLEWEEGDVAGLSTMFDQDSGQAVGFVEYRQTRQGDHLSMTRIAWFHDGSSDEDHAEALAGETLQALRGSSIIRDGSGTAVVDVSIDVVGDRIRGTWGEGADRRSVDVAAALPPATYWGPLIFLVLKNFEGNAVDGRVRFRTVVPTPEPRVLDLELVRHGPTTMQRTASTLEVLRFDLQPTVHRMVDPVIQRLAPQTRFFIQPGAPPALVRFAGPRNYAGQRIRLE